MDGVNVDAEGYVFVSFIHMPETVCRVLLASGSRGGCTVDLRQDEIRVDRELLPEALVQIECRSGPLPPVFDVVVSVAASSC